MACLQRDFAVIRRRQNKVIRIGDIVVSYSTILPGVTSAGVDSEALALCECCLALKESRLGLGNIVVVCAFGL